MEAKENYISTRYEGKDNSFNTINLRLNPEFMIEKLRRQLMNQTLFNPNIGMWETPEGKKPKFSEDGINEYIEIIEEAINIPSVLANLTKEEINESCRSIALQVRDLIKYKHYEYKIPEHMWVFLRDKAMNMVFNFLTRPLSGRENELLTQGLTATENINNTKQVSDEAMASSPGIMGGLFRGRR